MHLYKGDVLGITLNSHTTPGSNRTITISPSRDPKFSSVHPPAVSDHLSKVNAFDINLDSCVQWTQSHSYDGVYLSCEKNKHYVLGFSLVDMSYRGLTEIKKEQIRATVTCIDMEYSDSLKNIFIFCIDTELNQTLLYEKETLVLSFNGSSMHYNITESSQFKILFVEYQPNSTIILFHPLNVPTRPILFGSILYDKSTKIYKWMGYYSPLLRNVIDLGGWTDEFREIELYLPSSIAYFVYAHDMITVNICKFIPTPQTPNYPITMQCIPNERYSVQSSPNSTVLVQKRGFEEVDVKDIETVYFIVFYIVEKDRYLQRYDYIFIDRVADVSLRQFPAVDLGQELQDFQLFKGSNRSEYIFISARPVSDAAQDVLIVLDKISAKTIPLSETVPIYFQTHVFTEDQIGLTVIVSPELPYDKDAILQLGSSTITLYELGQRLKFNTSDLPSTTSVYYFNITCERVEKPSTDMVEMVLMA